MQSYTQNYCVKSKFLSIFWSWKVPIISHEILEISFIRVQTLKVLLLH
jgi:hypothetical protein